MSEQPAGVEIDNALREVLSAGLIPGYTVADDGMSVTPELTPDTDPESHAKLCRLVAEKLKNRRN